VKSLPLKLSESENSLLKKSAESLKSAMENVEKSL
jgi:hypothetical protein